MFDEPYVIPEPDYYTFVYEEPNNGWWLKIDSIDKLGDYMLKTEQMYGDCMEEYMRYAMNHDKDNEENKRIKLSNRLQAIIMFGEQRHLTIIDAIIQFRMCVFSQMCEAIREAGYIVINKVGGYHRGPVKYSQFVHRKTFTWPDFKESDIRISQFPGGEHYYVRIGDMELHEDGQIKWNTREEAMMVAQRYINKEVHNG
jgi:hypothetical protein